MSGKSFEKTLVVSALRLGGIVNKYQPRVWIPIPKSPYLRISVRLPTLKGGHSHSSGYLQLNSPIIGIPR